MQHYRLFAHPEHRQTGGKHIAVSWAEDLAPEQMQQLASASGAPLTVFVNSLDGDEARLHCFTPHKEKLESDSGALAAAAFLRSHGKCNTLLKAHMQGGNLTCSLQDGVWLASQITPEDEALHHDVLLTGKGLNRTLHALGLSETDLDARYPVAKVGTAKQNIIVPVQSATVLDGIQADMELLSIVQQQLKANGVIPCVLGQSRGGDADYRFFSPLKGLNEDNAGCYSFATVMAYMVEYALGKPSSFILKGVQGLAINKPSMLTARFALREHYFWVDVGGTVQEVTA